MVQSGITLEIEPRAQYTWDAFVSSHPPYSIALDGVVDEGVRRKIEGPYANFDHHKGVDRPTTLATCMQVFEEINMGLFKSFRREGIPHAIAHINDPDEDTCLAYWLLRNHELVVSHGNPRINRLVHVEDKLDRHAGAYPLHDTRIRRQMAWIFEPYSRARYSGDLFSMDGESMHHLVEAVYGRINEHVFEGGGEIALEGSYDVIGGGNGWKFVREKGPGSREKIMMDGIDAFVKLVAEKEDGSRVMTLWQRSLWEGWNLGHLYHVLNSMEPDGLITANNKWGGSNTVGGSPRETGTWLSVEEISDVVEREGRIK